MNTIIGCHVVDIKHLCDVAMFNRIKIQLVSNVNMFVLYVTLKEVQIILIERITSYLIKIELFLYLVLLSHGQRSPIGKFF